MSVIINENHFDNLDDTLEDTATDLAAGVAFRSTTEKFLNTNFRVQFFGHAASFFRARLLAVTNSVATRYLSLVLFEVLACCFLARRRMRARKFEKRGKPFSSSSNMSEIAWIASSSNRNTDPN